MSEDDASAVSELKDIILLNEQILFYYRAREEPPEELVTELKAAMLILPVFLGEDNVSTLIVDTLTALTEARAGQEQTRHNLYHMRHLCERLEGKKNPQHTVQVEVARDYRYFGWLMEFRSNAEVEDDEMELIRSNLKALTDRLTYEQKGLLSAASTRMTAEMTMDAALAFSTLVEGFNL